LAEIITPLHFRIAEMADLATIVEIYNSTIPSRMVTADTQPITLESRIGWFNAHKPDKWPLWVVEVDKEIIGWVGFEPFYDRPAYDHTAEISIYIAKESRGKNIGPAILEYAEERAKNLGLTSILGFIFAHNMPSLKLFEKAGYAEWGYFPEIALLDGERKGLKILGKHIG